MLQPTIGHEMWLQDGQRLRTYREFCDLLRDPAALVWFERILVYYLESGRGEKRPRC